VSLITQLNGIISFYNGIRKTPTVDAGTMAYVLLPKQTTLGATKRVFCCARLVLPTGCAGRHPVLTAFDNKALPTLWQCLIVADMAGPWAVCAGAFQGVPYDMGLGWYTPATSMLVCAASSMLVCVPNMWSRAQPRGSKELR